MDSLLYWIGLNSIPRVGPRKARLLLDVFGTPEKILSASRQELESIEGLDAGTVRSIQEDFDDRAAERQLLEAREKQIHIIPFSHPDYPCLLREISDPPLVLYTLGKPLDADFRSVALVGTRRISSYGKSVARKIVFGLAEAEITIVSGMARGVDSFVHRFALEAGVRTVAVLGCGVDVCYPPENERLMSDIASCGYVVSEFPPGTPPDGFRFPRRNRIIAGLSHGSVVVEAGAKSGAMITAVFALEQGREVFAVPGPIMASNSEGCHQLIKQGAGLVTTSQDILDGLKRPLGIFSGEKKEKPEPELVGEYREIYRHLSFEPVHIDLLSQRCERSASQVLSVLLNLELRGLVQQLAGKNFVKA